MVVAQALKLPVKSLAALKNGMRRPAMISSAGASVWADTRPDSTAEKICSVKRRAKFSSVWQRFGQIEFEGLLVGLQPGGAALGFDDFAVNADGIVLGDVFLFGKLLGRE